MSDSHKIYPQTLQECWQEIDELEAIIEGMGNVTDRDAQGIESLQAELVDATEEIKDLRAQIRDMGWQLEAARDEMNFHDRPRDWDW